MRMTVARRRRCFPLAVAFKALLLFAGPGPGRAGLVPVQVPQGQVLLVERWGKFTRTLEPGLHWLTPFAEQTRSIDLREKVLRCGRACATADRAEVDAVVAVQVRIVDPVLAAYATEDLMEALETVATSRVAVAVGTLSLEECLSTMEHNVLAESLREHLAELSRRWGVEVSRVMIERLEPTEATRRELERRAVIRAEAKRRERASLGLVLRAESEAEAERVRCDSQLESFRARKAAATEALERLRDTMGRDAALRIESLRLHYDALVEISVKSHAKTLAMPHEEGLLLNNHAEDQIIMTPPGGGLTPEDHQNNNNNFHAQHHDHHPRAEAFPPMDHTAPTLQSEKSNQITGSVFARGIW